MTKQLRAAVRALRAALLTVEPDGAESASAAIAAAADVLEGLGKELRTAVREGEPSSRARSSRPRTPRRVPRRSPRSGRRSGRAGDAGRPIDPRSPCIIGVAARTWHPDDVGDARRARAARRCGRRSRAGRGRRLRRGRRCSQRSTASTSSTARPASTTTRAARLAERLGVDPRTLLLGHRRHDDAAARRTRPRTRCSRGELDLALITSAEALATQRRRKQRGER